jgi:hypothetical protein
VKRHKDERSKASVDVGRYRSPSKSKTVAKPGYGDQGDLPKRRAKKATKEGKERWRINEVVRMSQNPA